MMEKMKMESTDGVTRNIEKLEALFPEVITEAINPDTKKVGKSIDFEVLKQILSGNLVDESSERYNFTWPGKREAMIEANRPIKKTLRPCIEESKNWNDTENIYIEGDNLDALKLIQESYLNSIKLIYIDPPYNTGNDFVYDDDFKVDSEKYFESIGSIDEKNNRMFKNTETNGLFHSDWCSMIYPRLKLAKSLLSEDGVIAISIDDNEIGNLLKICDEAFGSANHVGIVIWERAFAPKNDAKYFSASHDYIVFYAKSINSFQIGKLPRTKEADARYKNPDSDPRGAWTADNLTVKTYSAAYDYPITTPGGRIVNPSSGSCWRVSKTRFDELVADNRVYFGDDGNNVPRLKRFLSELQDGMTPTTMWKFNDVGHNQEGRQELKKLFDGKGYFDGPKPQRLMQRILKVANVGKNDIVLDFFSGSGSTAQAVMDLNLDDCGCRKFIMVQLPEPIEEKTDAYENGYRTLCDIGIERIRRAGKQVESKLNSKEIDTGFRKFRIDESNMKDVYFTPNEYQQKSIDGMIDNIKEDRNDLDLLFGIMAEWGLKLSLPIKTISIDSKTTYSVDSNSLIACFERQISEQAVREVAKMKPTFVVFRDSSFANSQNKINLEEIFKNDSPETVIKVI